MAILSFLFRMRIAVLAVLALGTAASAFFAFHGHAVPVGALFLTAASLGIGAGIAFLHLRHVGLSAIAALSPLPGMIAASLIAAGLSYSQLLAVYGFGYVAAACLCGAVVRGVLNNEQLAAAARMALARGFAPTLLAALVAAALVVSLLFREARLSGAVEACEVVAAAVSVLAFVPFTACIVPFGEPFFAAANRARERRERLLHLAAWAAQPRWGLSLAGIAAVFAVLGWFGAWPFVARSALYLELALWGAALLPVFLMAWGIGRDWRGAAAVTLALGALTLLSLWLWGRAAGHLTAAAFAESAVATSAGFVPMLMLLGQLRRYRQAGDEAAVARLRAVEELGVAAGFGAAGAAAAIAPWIVLHGSIATLAALYLFAGAAAVLAVPAIATALDAVLPRRRSLSQLYGRG